MVYDRPFLPEDDPNINIGYGGSQILPGHEPTTDDGGAPPAPGDDYAVDFIPGSYELWVVGGQYYLVYMMPTPSGDQIPLAFTATQEQLTNHFGSGGVPSVTRRLTEVEFASVGGLTMGGFTDLDNPDSNPFDTWVEKITEQATIYPWLLDPEIMAVTGAAWLEGRGATLAELVGTTWWKNHSQTERDWLTFSLADPVGGRQRIEDNRIKVWNDLRTAGVNNPSDALVNRLADQFTKGLWTSTFVNYQIELLANPGLDGEIDPSLLGYVGTLDTNQSRGQEVRDLVRRWLGPLHGNWSQEQVDEWSARFRTEPDAKDELVALLSGQRVALFPEYGDRSLTYDDIASPWRNMVMSRWGRMPDESEGFFVDLVRENDATTAGQMLRSEGLNRGIKSVTNEVMLSAMSAFGGEVARV